MTVDDIPRALQSFADSGVGLLAASGGDGTHHAVLSAMVLFYRARGEPMPIYLPLKDGTNNNLAHSTGISGDMPSYFSRAHMAFKNGDYSTIKRDLVAVNDLQGFIVGIGAGAKLVEAYYDGQTRGSLRAAILTVHFILSVLSAGPFAQRVLEPVEMLVQFDDTEKWMAPRALVAGTLMQTGFGFRFLSRAHERKGYLHLLAAESSAWTLVGHIPRLYLGKPIPKMDSILNEVLHKVEFRFERPQNYMIDGEMYGPVDDLSIQVETEIEILSIH